MIKWILPAKLPTFTYNPAVMNHSYNPFGAMAFNRYSTYNFKALPMFPMLPMPNFKLPLLSFTKSGYKANSSVRLNSGGGNDFVSTANKYLGYNESDNSYKLFTKGKSHAWCADFVSHVVKESCQKSGKSIPAGFGSSSVEGLRQWGKNNGCYLQTAGASNKSQLISQNVKKGDVIIFKENGRSHTGIVTSIENGKIHTTEGNTSNKVAQRSYALNDNTISGFVQVA